MKYIITIFFLALSCMSRAQCSSTMTITVFGQPSLFVCDSLIYLDSVVNPGKLYGTIRGKRIYKGSGTRDQDVILTIVGDKVYDTHVISAKTLLLYREADTVYLRRKDGKFARGGVYSPNNQRGKLYYGLYRSYRIPRIDDRRREGLIITSIKRSFKERPLYVFSKVHLFQELLK